MRDRDRRRRLLDALAVALGCGVVAGAVVLPAPAATASSSCVDAAIVAFRGSGETQSDLDEAEPLDVIETGGWEGKILHRLLLGYEERVPLDVAASVPVLDIGGGSDPRTAASGYPAAATDNSGWAWLPSVLYDSAGRGADEALARLAELERGCPPVRLVLLGYSQGAVAARSLAAKVPGQVVATFFFGDPLQHADAPGNLGTGAGADGVLRTLPGFDGTSVDQFDGLPFARSSYCDATDGVCAGDVNALSSLAHERYLTDPLQLAYFSARLASAVTAAASPDLDVETAAFDTRTAAATAPSEGASVPAQIALASPAMAPQRIFVDALLTLFRLPERMFELAAPHPVGAASP